MILKIPELNEFKEIIIRLTKPRKCKPTKNARLTYFPDKSELPNSVGVYIIKKGDKIEYIGQTINIRKRIASHLSDGVLSKNPEIKKIYFLPMRNKGECEIFEKIYMYIFFGELKNKKEYSSFIKNKWATIELTPEEMRKETEKPLVDMDYIRT